MIKKEKEKTCFRPVAKNIAYANTYMHFTVDQYQPNTNCDPFYIVRGHRYSML